MTTGRHAGPSPVVAAGALLWRVVDGKVRVLVVHRGRRADVSLPKGKLEPGELCPQTAVREVLEETGYRVALGAPLGVVEYTLPSGRPKIVHYWAAEVDVDAPTRFAPTAEIASIEWLSLRKARETLSYAHDVDVVRRFGELVDAGRAATFAVIALRHGKAVPHEQWHGPDSERPLQSRGRRQAESVAPAIAAYGPAKLISSTAVRCVTTIQPVSKAVGIHFDRTDAISQDSHEEGLGRVAEVIAKRLDRARTAVLCSHGPVLPVIVGEVARATDTPVDARLRRAALLSTGEFSVLHVARDDPRSQLVAVEVHAPVE